MKVHYFTASWCGPCRNFGPTIEAVQADYGFNFSKNSITLPEDPEKEAQNKELAASLGVRNIPAVIIVDDNGVEVARSVGALDRNKLVEFLAAHKVID